MQYGAGLSSPNGWMNFDASPTLRLQRTPLLGPLFNSIKPKFPAGVRVGDIVKGLPLPRMSCSNIYCSHILEHLSYTDCFIALKNTFDYLEPGGRFRFVLPDLKFLAEKYVNSDDKGAAHTFMKESYLGQLIRPKGIGGLARMLFGNTKHLWMWDFESIRHALLETGFTEIRRAYLGDSGDPIYEYVEAPGRWENCLGVDCKRPITNNSIGS
jgi:hypothetical protein